MSQPHEAVGDLLAEDPTMLEYPMVKEICKTSGGKIPAVVSKVQQLTDEK